MKITAKIGQYIKLGKKGAWEDICLKDGTMRLGYYEVPHEIASAGNKETIRQVYVDLNHDAGTASNYARQVLSFYDPSDIIWLTFADGFLWWCKAAPEVEYLGNNPEIYKHGSRLRRTIGAWRNCSLQGKPLRIMELKGDLTKVSAYRQVICDIKPQLLEYLLRKINDEEIPEIKAGHLAKNNMLTALQGMIEMLHWKDFELLVDLIFSSSGWQRVSITGGAMKTTDMELKMPITGERAMVQIKSETTHAQFNKYIDAFDRWNMPRLFYAYHTADKPLIPHEDPRITVMGPDTLSIHAMQAGLTEWVMDKVG